MRIPSSTYRFQFHSTFGFSEATKSLEYLSDLGISHIYASPVFKARKGSLHGYDIVDQNQINHELGTWDEFSALLSAVNHLSMGWIQDVVPNHMAYDYENEMLVDVMENGPCSGYFSFFDIEWDLPHQISQGGLLAPFLGRFYSESLEDGEIRLMYNKNGFTIHYYDLQFPLRIESYTRVLTHGFASLKKKLGEEHPDFIKFLGVLYVFRTLPSGEEIKERWAQIKFVKRMLWEVYQKNKDIRTILPLVTNFIVYFSLHDAKLTGAASS